MTKEERRYKTLKDRINALVAEWKNNLLLQAWEINVWFNHGERDTSRDQGHLVAVATTSAEWDYMRARVTFNLRDLVDESDELVENTVVHELIHCVVNEMKEMEPKHEERVVTSLTSSFMMLRKPCPKKR